MHLQLTKVVISSLLSTWYAICVISLLPSSTTSLSSLLIILDMINGGSYVLKCNELAAIRNLCSAFFAFSPSLLFRVLCSLRRLISPLCLTGLKDNDGPCSAITGLLNLLHYHFFPSASNDHQLNSYLKKKRRVRRESEIANCYQ